MKYFTLHELCRSNMAALHGVDNTPTPEISCRLTDLVNHVLDPVREMWGKPITVNSGYRSHALNNLVGGAKTSQHLTGDAADITTGSKESNRKLFDIIKNGNIPFDQLIDESGCAWIHISYSPRNRRQVLYL